MRRIEIRSSEGMATATMAITITTTITITLPVLVAMVLQLQHLQHPQQQRQQLRLLPRGGNTSAVVTSMQQLRLPRASTVLQSYAALSDAPVGTCVNVTE